MAESTIGLLRVVLASNSAQFSSDMGKASTSVSGFDKTAQSAAKSLASMVSGFNGTKAMAEAQKVAQAVLQVEGAAKLTGAELNRVRSTLDAAISKFGTFGKEVPADVAKVRAEIAALDQAAARTAAPSGGLGQWTGALGGIGRLLPGLSVAGIVAGATALGKAAFESAGQIIDLKNKTGLSTDAIQEMQFVAKQTGTSLESFTNSAFKLGVNIAAGTAKATDAVKDLGLSYSDLKAMKPEDQFATIVRALEGVDNQQERNRLGVALFGKQFAEIAGSIQEGYSGIAESATKSTQAQLRALDNAADKWEEFKTNFQTGYRSMLGTIVQGISDVERAADSLSIAQKATLFVQGGGNPAAYIASLKEMGLGLRETEDAVKQATDAFNKLPPNIGTATTATASYSAALKEATDFVKGLSTAQRTELNAALKLGGDAAKDYADSIGMSEAALRLYESGVKDSGKATKDLAAEKEKASAAAKKFAESVTFVKLRLVEFSTATQMGSAAIRNLAAGLNENGTLITRTTAEIEAAAKATAEWVRQNGMLKGSIEAQGPALDAAGEKTEGFFQKVFGGAEGLGQSVSSIFMAAFTGGGGALGAVQAFATKGLQVLLGMIPGVGAFVSAFAGPIVAMLSKLAGKFKDFFSNLFGGASASERRGRESVAAFEDELAGMLNATQEAEAGGEDWKRTIIAIRDAYIAAGRSGEEALTDAKRLWESSKISAEESLRVIEEIRRKMNQLPTEQEITVRVNYEAGNPLPNPGVDPNDPGAHTMPVPFATGTMGRFGSWFNDFGSKFPASLHGVEAVLRPQDAIPFANAVMGGLMPMGAGTSSSTTTNSINVLPVIMGSGLTSRDIGRQAAHYLSSSGLQNDESGITSAFEAVIDNWMRTYAR